MSAYELAKQAFYGSNEPLMDHIRNERSYELDGVAYPSNGVTLAEAVETVEGMTDEVLAFFE